MPPFVVTELNATLMRFRLAALLFLLVHVGAGCRKDPSHAESGQPSVPGMPPACDILIFAPHSDDEAIGCTGVMLQALERKQRVVVVIISAGDAHVRAAAIVARKEQADLRPEDFLKLAAVRQQHSLRAMARVGIPKESLVFLGYPDGGLNILWQGKPQGSYLQPHTRKSETYGEVAPDYHSRVHGSPAPYTKASVLADIAEIVKACRPQEIYVTNDLDTHADHMASFHLVRAAARTAGYRGTLFTYVVHGRPPAEAPGRRVALSPAQLETKRSVIRLYQEGTSPVHDMLADTYALPEELFWPVLIE
jgi:LmbE family N-acetylglucosaminyl deacetylase